MDWHNYFILNCADLSGVAARSENIFLKLDLDNASERIEISQSPCLNRLGLCILNTFARFYRTDIHLCDEPGSLLRQECSFYRRKNPGECAPDQRSVSGLNALITLHGLGISFRLFQNSRNKLYPHQERIQEPDQKYIPANKELTIEKAAQQWVITFNRIGDLYGTATGFLFSWHSSRLFIIIGQQ